VQQKSLNEMIFTFLVIRCAEPYSATRCFAVKSHDASIYKPTDCPDVDSGCCQRLPGTNFIQLCQFYTFEKSHLTHRGGN